jgi:hypothetical protein
MFLFLFLFDEHIHDRENEHGEGHGHGRNQCPNSCPSHKFFLKISQAKSSISKVAKVSKANLKKKILQTTKIWPRRAKIRIIFFSPNTI